MTYSTGRCTYYSVIWFLKEIFDCWKKFKKSSPIMFTCFFFHIFRHYLMAHLFARYMHVELRWIRIRGFFFLFTCPFPFAVAWLFDLSQDMEVKGTSSIIRVIPLILFRNTSFWNNISLIKISLENLMVLWQWEQSIILKNFEF